MLFCRSILNADMNECTSGGAKCHSDAICDNTIGSYTCQCYAGKTGDGVLCTGTTDRAQLQKTLTCLSSHLYGGILTLDHAVNS